MAAAAAAASAAKRNLLLLQAAQTPPVAVRRRLELWRRWSLIESLWRQREFKPAFFSVSLSSKAHEDLW